jgi:hypothetical protein
MENIETIKALAQERLEEAEILCQNGKYDGAFYLAGYSVELTLKYKVCEWFGIPNLFKEWDGNEKKTEDDKKIEGLRKLVKTHDLEFLLVLSGLKNKFDDYKAKLEGKELSKANSLLFTCWDEKVRYKPCGHTKPEDVQHLLFLIKNLIKWIQEN